MSGFLGEAYNWVKAAHVILVIFWMAGMFMLPRFFAYHAEDIAKHGLGSAIDLDWRERERRLLRIIVNPAMIGVWVFGLLAAVDLGFVGNKWLHWKIMLVFALSGYHGWLAGTYKRFARGQNAKDGRFYRLMNEVPTLATIPIVILAVLKPTW